MTNPTQQPPPWPPAGQPYSGYVPPEEPKKRNWVARHKVLTGLGAVLTLGVIGVATGQGDDPNNGVVAVPPVTQPAVTQAHSTAAKAPASPNAVTKSWKRVIAVSGSSNKRTALFELGDGPSRLRYTVTDTSGIGAGVVAVYVVDEGSSLEKNGGFAEVTTSGKSESDTTQLAKSSGRYYLDVMAANSRWNVVVEELK